MSQVKKVAHKFQTKLAQNLREYNMGTKENPNLNNIVKNIQQLIDGFNYLSSELEKQKAAVSEDSTAQQLQEAGITVT